MNDKIELSMPEPTNGSGITISKENISLEKPFSNTEYFLMEIINNLYAAIQISMDIENNPTDIDTYFKLELGIEPKIIEGIRKELFSNYLNEEERNKAIELFSKKIQ